MDTSALISLYNLQSLEHLSLMYEEVRIPREVEREFLDKVSEDEKTRRFAFIAKFYDINQSWFVPCLDYGSDLIEIYLASDGMDRGEAEVLAQNQSLDNLYEVIIDESIARGVAQSKSFKVHGVLYLLAVLSIRFQKIDYNASVDYLIKEQNFRLKSKVANQVYEKVRKEILG